MLRRLGLDLVAIRVSPLPPWVRYAETWDDIMDEIDLEDLARRVEQLESEQHKSARLIRQASMLMLSNQKLIGDILHSQVLMINKLGDRGGSNDDGV